MLWFQSVIRISALFFHNFKQLLYDVKWIKSYIFQGIQSICLGPNGFDTIMPNGVLG